MLYRVNKYFKSTKIRPVRLTNWPESHFCIQMGHIRDILCTCDKLASSQQVFHPLFTENRNATNQSWRISTWCIRHFSPVQHSSEVLRCNSLIVIPIFSCWYGNATTVSDVFCLFVVYMYTKHVTYQIRIVSFYNYYIVGGIALIKWSMPIIIFMLCCLEVRDVSANVLETNIA